MPAEGKLTPRVAEALRIWDGLVESERSYAKVAEAMGISPGRAAVYVRDALNATGRIDEAPRGRAGNGVNVMQAPQSPEAMLKANAEQLRHRIEALGETAEEFDAEAWIAEQETVLAERVKQAQATLKQWRDDAEGVATEAAKAEAKRRSARVEANEEQAESLRATLASYEAALAAMTAAA